MVVFPICCVSLVGDHWQIQCRRIDARMIMLYKIIHGYVAIQLPSYFERPTRYTRHMHRLAFRHIHTGVKYDQNSLYPVSIVL